MSGFEIAAGVGLLAAGIGTATTVVGAQRSADAQEINADLAEQQAKYLRRQSQAEADAQRARDRRLQAAQRARFAANNLDITTGSPFAVMSEDAAAADVDYRMILTQGQVESNRLRTQAALDRHGAQSTRLTGYLGAASTAFSGSASAYNTYAEGAHRRDMAKRYTGG